MQNNPELWKHQIRALEKGLDQIQFALFMEPGTGKTRTLIELLRYRFNLEKKIFRTLIFTPPIVVPQWKEEFLRFSKIKPNQIGLLTGSQKKRIETLHKFPIVITNYESLIMKDLYAEFLNWSPEAIVLDESHKIKTHNSKRTKAAVALGRKAKYKYLLTGTPVLNSPMDLFSQFLFLDNGETFGANYYAFRNTYFYDKNAGMPKHIHFPNWQPRPHCNEELKNKIAPKSFSVKKEECLDLPDLVKKIIHVDLSPEQEKHYEMMRDEFITYINDEACVANLAITKALRLQQIVSGFIATEKQEHKFKETPRDTALKELLEEITLSNKVLVWAVFKNNYESIKRICEALNIGYVEVHGDISATQKKSNVDRFNTDPSIRVFISNPGAGGVGLNLTAASYSIFYSRNFSLEFDLQAEARNYRGGSEIHAKITRIDLVAKDTIDELILERLAAKETIGEKIVFELASKLGKS